MYIALSYERARIQRLAQGRNVSTVAEPESVFDVSTRSALSAARESERFMRAVQLLEQQGVNPESPGFDILTLMPFSDVEIDRLIELKSSGNRARSQEMTWNEWKTAQNSSLRGRFHLYLAGNLRCDLDATPFLRMICDPFEVLLSEERFETRESRSVRLDLEVFEAAEELELTARATDERDLG